MADRYNPLCLYYTCPAFICNVQIVPGISDHEAITFNYNCECSLPMDASHHCAPLYHKADVNKFKATMFNFQEQFLNPYPYSQDVEANWIRFKQTISDAENESIPKKTYKSKNHLPWITHSIMQKRKQLYKKAKCLQSESAWSAYRLLKNTITKEVRVAHGDYQNSLFDSNTDAHHKKFWRYIKSQQKGQTGVSPLHVDDKVLTNSKDKAEALNKQLYSVFTDEDQTNIPECTGHPFSKMPNISFFPDSIQNLLDNLDTNKTTGPDNISAWV